jgi:glycosyltransferase involved in cell wall biosynthesis
VHYVGEISDQEKSSFLGNAAGLLFPIDWPEPFGLSMIEAFACGTPVIAWDIASVPEIVDDGVTGFIVSNIADAVTAVHRLDGLDRRRVRRVFEQRFTADRMARDYVAIYRRLLESARGRCALGRAPSRDSVPS